VLQPTARTARRALFVAVLGASVALSGTSAFAGGKGGGGAGSGGTTTQPSGAPLSLASDSTWNNPNSPSWCMNEDDYDQAVYSGSLNGSASRTEQLCGLSSDYYNNVYWDAGGIGLESDVYVTGQLADLSITAPDGTVHHAVLVGQASSKGTTTYHYATCYVPTYSVSTDTGGRPLPGGTWQVALSGQSTTTRWNVNVVMTDAPFQKSYCPSAQQNLVA